MKNLIRCLLVAATLLPASLWAGTLTGRVTNAAGGAAIANALVVVRQGGAGTPILDSARTNATGNYTTTVNLAAGVNYRTTVTATGFTTATVFPDTITATGASTTNFALTASTTTGGTLSGRVTNAAGGAAIANALITVQQGGVGSPVLDSVRTNATGNYTITGIPAATNYRVTASATGFTAATVVPDTIRTGATTTTNFALTATTTTGGTISGTVTNAAGGAAIAGALVTVQQGGTGSPILDSVRTSATGTYTITGVPAATNYRVTASATGFTAATVVPDTVRAGATTTTNFALTATVAATGTIVGTVRAGSATGAVVANALVVLRRTSATGAIVDSVRTNSNGAYVFLNVASGTPNYWIMATAAAGTGTNANVAVGAGVTVTSNIILATASIYQAASGNGIHFSTAGSQLALDLGVSNVARTVTVYSMNGILRNRTSVPAGASRAVLPAAFAPANGFLFQVK